MSFIKNFDEKIKEENPDGKHLINIGVCGLHVVNGAIKTGLQMAKWEVDSFLRDVYYIFNDSPARHADFIELTGKSIFPLKHCIQNARWKFF